MTAKSADGSEIFRAERDYRTQPASCLRAKMLGAADRSSSVRDTSLQPYEPKSETFEVRLPEGVRTAEIRVALIYEFRSPANRVLIHETTRSVTLDR